MPLKKHTGDDLLESLLDTRVVDALVTALGEKIAGIVETRLESKFQNLFDSFAVLKADNVHSNKAISELEKDNKALKIRLDDLEVYSRLDNLVIHGIAETSYSEAGSARPTSSRDGRQSTNMSNRGLDESGGPLESNSRTEAAVI